MFALCKLQILNNIRQNMSQIEGKPKDQNYPAYHGENANYGGIQYYDRRIYVNETDYFLPSVTLQVRSYTPFNSIQTCIRQNP